MWGGMTLIQGNTSVEVDENLRKMWHTCLYLMSSRDRKHGFIFI